MGAAERVEFDQNAQTWWIENTGVEVVSTWFLKMLSYDAD